MKIVTKSIQVGAATADEVDPAGQVEVNCSRVYPEFSLISRKNELGLCRIIFSVSSSLKVKAVIVIQTDR